MSTYGRIGVGSQLIGRECPRCRRCFDLGDDVEVYGYLRETIVAHAMCPIAEDSLPKKKLPKVLDLDRLEPMDKYAYETGRW